MLLQLNILAFHGNKQVRALGNTCKLHISEDLAPSTISSQLTSCYSSPINNKPLHYQVSCFSGVKSILCCGHGLLSSAYFWLEKTQKKLIYLSMHETRLRAWREQNTIWIEFFRLKTKACPVPVWAEHFFSIDPPIAAALAGGDQGYLILQWLDNAKIECLSCPNMSLSQYTQRALICTAKQNSASNNIDIIYRYFAPQYTDKEDTATGSAMRILVDFWQKPKLTALQVSPRKGLLFGKLNADTVAVGGYCSKVI